MSHKAKKRMAESLIAGLEDAVAYKCGKKSLRTTKATVSKLAPRQVATPTRKLRKRTRK